MIEIRHRYTNEVLHTYEGASLSGVDLSDLNLHRVNLSHTNLSYANLRHSNIENANFIGANLFGSEVRKQPICISSLRWWILITETHMQIGCKTYTHKEWEEFSDEFIQRMDRSALAFWHQNKSMLLSLCEFQRNKDD